jgi:uncharacterized protein (UPF0548 family)
MRILLNSRFPVSESCPRWGALAGNSPPSGPSNPSVDHYQSEARVAAGKSAVVTFERVRERLFSYDIFPPRLFQAAIDPPVRVTEGATIIQRVVLGPVALEMAVRVTDVWDRQDGKRREAGFSYATVQGHAECGVAAFRVRLDADQRVTVLFDARSRPGTLLTRLSRPVARLFQRSMTRAALRRVCAQ